ncbi:MAG: hypothetical protein AB1861_29215 [Cyanobacteriota bacterium]
MLQESSQRMEAIAFLEKSNQVFDCLIAPVAIASGMLCDRYRQKCVFAPKGRVCCDRFLFLNQGIIAIAPCTSRSVCICAILLYKLRSLKKRLTAYAPASAEIYYSVV